MSGMFGDIFKDPRNRVGLAFVGALVLLLLVMAVVEYAF